jgi:hypothetical protein
MAHWSKMAAFDFEMVLDLNSCMMLVHFSTICFCSSDNSDGSNEESVGRAESLVDA